MGKPGQYLYCNVYYGDATIPEHYLAGNYYNWFAATNGATISSNSTNTSICPSGWYLPTGNGVTTSGSFGLLLNDLSSSAVTIAPYYFVYGGDVNNSELTTAGSLGHYWSATAFNASTAYRLLFDSSGVYLSNGNIRYFGASVRCVAR